MADELHLQRFIPFRKSDVVEMCLAEVACRIRRDRPSGTSAGFSKRSSISNFIDAAEEEEFKEAVLAYYFLLVSGAGLTRLELDRAVEKWLAERWNCHINFEVDDALKKLERLGIISILADKIRCRFLEDAKRHLDKSWDNFFDFGPSQGTGRFN
jgi:hypothetical protein